LEHLAAVINLPISISIGKFDVFDERSFVIVGKFLSEHFATNMNLLISMLTNQTDFRKIEVF
jgi:hypothetical protein